MNEPYSDLTDQQLDALYHKTVAEARDVGEKGEDTWPTAVRLGEIVFAKRNRERRAK